MTLFIARLGSAEPIRFAAQELYNYLKRMDPAADLALLSAAAYDPGRERTLWVGEDPAFERLLPEVEDRSLDDGICLRVEHGVGIVTGTNPRSVLLAVYRLLRENGCAFLKPGADGEIVPARCVDRLSARVCEAASYRHRGVCIEGAVGYAHVKNMICFLPKIGMNAYFIQFFVPYTFFDRWYAHAGNPLYEVNPISREEVMELRDNLVEEIKERGLLYHAVGHGWTCEPFGVAGDGWDHKVSEVPEGVRPLLAEVNGERVWWGGIPLNTNLCYGDLRARDRVTSAIADYCAAHPEVDYLHFWLADGVNNHCECPLCRNTAPSDFYVRMLNELDEKMTARGISTKIVFLIYVDLLWAPEKEKLTHPERFVMMFAPITRTYTTPFLPSEDHRAELAKYDRNKNVMPRSVSENIARLREWQLQFRGDGFDFDYHFMWDHHKDPGYFEMARILMQDVKNLSEIGLRGMVACQNQRVFFPNALGMHAMAGALWNRRIDFDELAADYFLRQYGADGPAVLAYLREISARIDPPYIRMEKPRVDAAQAERYRTVRPFVESFLPTIEKNQRENAEPCVLRAWRELQLHAGLLIRMAEMLSLRADGDDNAAVEAWRETAEFARALEREVDEDFDAFEYLLALGGVMERR